MDISKQRGRVLRAVASLPGSRDVHGSPLLVINPEAQANTEGFDKADFPYEDLCSVLGYLAEIPDRESVEKGITTLIDARKLNSKQLRSVLRACQQSLYKKTRHVLIVQPEKFLDQQKINFDLIRDAHNFKTTLVSVHKLTRHVSTPQLPECFGGTHVYDAAEWCAEREKYESCLHKVHARLTEVQGGQALEEEDAVLKEIELAAAHFHSLSADRPNADYAAYARRLRHAVEQVKCAASRPILEAEHVKRQVEHEEKTRMLEEHAQGVTSLLDWLEGSGEKWLLTLHEIGESRDEARQLVKEHATLAKKSEDMLTQADELADLATRLTATAPEHAITLEKAKDHVLSMAQSFSSRVKRQTAMAERSEHFHALVSEFSRKTDQLLEWLCSEKTSPADVAAVDNEKQQLEERVQGVESVYTQLSSQGAEFCEELSCRELNAMGRRVTRDYSAGIAHIDEQIGAARQRRRRCLDLVDGRRLRLQHFTQLYTCEQDATQAITWLDELYDTLAREYSPAGCNDDDLRALREDVGKLEETARSTYEYGKQLCQAALVLRRTLRIDSPPVDQLQRLEQQWARLCRAIGDNEAKINVTSAFNSTVVEVLHRIDELGCRVRETVAGRAHSLPSTSIYSAERRRLNGDIQELRHIADMLTSQINANHQIPVGARQEAIAGLRRKVEGVEERHREMESLFMENPPSHSGEERVMSISSIPAHMKQATDRISAIRLSDTESYL